MVEPPVAAVTPTCKPFLVNVSETARVKVCVAGLCGVGTLVAVFKW